MYTYTFVLLRTLKYTQVLVSTLKDSLVPFQKLPLTDLRSLSTKYDHSRTYSFRVILLFLADHPSSLPTEYRYSSTYETRDI